MISSLDAKPQQCLHGSLAAITEPSVPNVRMQPCVAMGLRPEGHDRHAGSITTYRTSTVFSILNENKHMIVLTPAKIRIFIRYILINMIVFAIFCVFNIDVIFPKAAAEIYGQDHTAVLSRTEFLRLVEVLISNGQLDEAKRLVDGLPDDGPLATDKLFLSAKIAEAEDDYKRAEKLYRLILRDNPSLHRVRLDLAHSLFARGNFDAADYHFRLVLAADIPNEVRRNIRPFLDRIRRERWWEASFSFAVVPDSNINTGPNVKAVNILGQPFQLSDDATETSGVGFESIFDGEVRPRISDNTRIVLGANVFSLDYLNEDFDDRSVTMRLGPIVSFPHGEVAVLGQGFKRWFAGDSYSHGFGPSVRANYDARYNLLLSGWASYFDIDNEINNGLDGSAFSLGGAATYTLSDRSFLRLFGGWASENRDDDAASSDLYRIGVGMSRELFWGLAGYIAPEFQHRPYGGRDALFGERRSDDLYRIEGRLIFGREVLPDLTPFISVSYEKNNSNIGFYSYQRIRGSLGFTKRF
jgi:tetratricopeptide (TPR) repeat protein